MFLWTDNLCNILFPKRIFTARFKYAICIEQSIEQRLGLPVSPKKPLTAYFQYLIEVRKSVFAQNPTLKVTDQVKLISQMWHSLDEKKKEKYTEAHQNAWIKYREQLAEYNQTITAVDKQTVKEKRKFIQYEIERRKIIRLQRKKALSFCKPTKPQPPFFRFLKVRADRQPSEKYREYLKRKSSEWKNLSGSQKEVFKIPEGDMQNFS